MAKGTSYGNWAFLVGLIIALVAGFVNIPFYALILVLLGLVVGFLNVSVKETHGFLVATVALIVAGSANLDLVWSGLTAILGNIVIFVAPAALVVAIKALYEIASH